MKKLSLITTIYIVLSLLFVIGNFTAVMAGLGQSVSRTFQPSSADSYIDGTLTDQNYGGLAYMYVKNKSNVQRSLVQFDLSSIPLGSNISSATLYLYASTAASGRTYDAYRITSTWTEGGITYTSQPTIAGAATASAASGTTMSFTVTSDLQTWIENQTATNYGWLVKDQSEGTSGPTQTSIYTREEGTETTLRPKLSVTYIADTWDSHKTDYTGPILDDFVDLGTEHTVYMRGTGFADIEYNLVYWDGGDNKRVTETLSAVGGILDSEHTFEAGVDVAGTWYVSVYIGATPAAHGTTTNLWADDSFTVQDSAIPEFSTVIAAIGVAGLCFGIYWWMRKRARRVHGVC